MKDMLNSEMQFFRVWRSELVQAMTLADVLPEGNLYYYESPYSCDVWVIVGPHTLLVAYPLRESPQGIRDRVRLWQAALKARQEPARTLEMGCPVYAAEEDRVSGEVTVAWFRPGDWCGLAMEHNRPLPRNWNQLPVGWSEANSARIAELAERRTGISTDEVFSA